MYSGNRGPGTFVVTVCINDWGNRNVSREPSASRVGAAKPARPVSTSAPTAWRLLLRSSICARMRFSRATGSGSPTGRLTITAATRLFSVPRSLGARTETGTSVRTV